VRAITGCIYLAVTLPADTWVRFAVWMVLGLVVYVLYARGSSRVGRAADAAPPLWRRGIRRRRPT